MFKFFWVDNKFTYLKDLAKVDIKPREKKSIRKVQLWQVDTVQMKISYLQEGILHDMRMTDVQAIYPCSQSRHMIVFNNPFRPQIVFADQNITNYAGICDFVYSIPANEADSLLLVPAADTTPSPDTLRINMSAKKSPPEVTEDSSLSNGRYDTIVRPNLTRMRIIIVSQTTKALVYRRYDNPYGPVYYVMPSTIRQTYRRWNGLTFIQNTY